MAPQSLEQYRKAWIFRHKDMPVDEENLLRITPLGEARSLQLWQQHVSNQSQHPEHFEGDDWPAKESCWHEQGEWQELWESDEPDLPQSILQALDWAENTVVYFCYDSRDIVETKWDVFRKHWKNFLFFDDGPLLLGKKRKQVVQFHQDGSFSLGNRPG